MQVIEGFIADFFCEEIKLVIEVDGGIHNKMEQKKIDEYRDKIFSARGITTIRSPNDDVLNHTDECLQQIADIGIKQRRLIQSPLRRGEGSKKPKTQKSFVKKNTPDDNPHARLFWSGTIAGN